MVSKYDPLTSALRAAAERGQRTVDLDFDEVDALVGGLPASAGVRQWWANSEQVHALAWRAAGFHVASVSLDRRRVRFSRDERGDLARDDQEAAMPQKGRPAMSESAVVERWPLVGEQVDVRVLIDWADAGSVVLDAADKPTFGSLPAVPGLYRLTSTGRPNQLRPRVYIGESDNLRRRLSRNYRSPGSGQQTSLRINAALRNHLGAGGLVHLVIATAAQVAIPGLSPTPVTLDLASKAARLLAENAALVTALLADDADVENLP